MRYGEENNDTYHSCSDQMKTKINPSYPMTTWTTHSTLLDHTRRKNQHQKIIHNENIKVSVQQLTNGPDGDLWLQNGVLQANQKETGRITTCSRFSTKQEHTANWFHTKIINGLGDILFLSQKWPELPYLEDQELMLCQTLYWHTCNCLILLETLYNKLWTTRPHWIRRIQSNAKKNQLELFIASWIRNWFTQFQTRIWQP